jgi:hypothetical protein
MIQCEADSQWDDNAIAVRLDWVSVQLWIVELLFGRTSSTS